MISRRLGTVLAVVVVCALALAGCPQTPDLTTATVIVVADLSPAYESDVDVDSVAVVLTGSNTYQFDLEVDAGSKTATGSLQGVDLGEYTVDISMAAGGSTVGIATDTLFVEADVTISVRIVIDAAGGGSGGTIDVELE